MNPISTVALICVFKSMYSIKIDTTIENIENLPQALSKQNIVNLIRASKSGLLKITKSRFRKLNWDVISVYELLNGFDATQYIHHIIPSSFCLRDRECLSLIEDFLRRDLPIPWNLFENSQALQIELLSTEFHQKLLAHILNNQIQNSKSLEGIQPAIFPTKNWELLYFYLVERGNEYCKDLNLEEHFDNWPENNLDYSLMMGSLTSINENVMIEYRIDTIIERIYSIESLRDDEKNALIGEFNEKNTDLILNYAEKSESFALTSLVCKIVMKRGDHHDRVLDIMNNFEFVNVPPFYTYALYKIFYDKLESFSLFDYPNIYQNLFSLKNLLKVSRIRRRIANFIPADDQGTPLVLNLEDKKLYFDCNKSIHIQVQWIDNFTRQRILEKNSSAVSSKPNLSEFFYNALFDKSLRGERMDFITLDSRETCDLKNFWNIVDSFFFFFRPRFILRKIFLNE